MGKQSGSSGREDITCSECGKVDGSRPTGTHWICEDCKVSDADSISEPGTDK
jgi:ribosomal protein L37AE/L43A